MQLRANDIFQFLKVLIFSSETNKFIKHERALRARTEASPNKIEGARSAGGRGGSDHFAKSMEGLTSWISGIQDFARRNQRIFSMVI